MGLKKIFDKAEIIGQSKAVKVITIILWVIQAGLGLFGLIIALGMTLSFNLLSIIAAFITALSALIILPIMDFIKPVRKYSMPLLLPRAIISFMVLIAAFMIFPDTSPFNENNKVENSITQETTTTTFATTLTTTATTTTNTTTSKTTMTTTTTTTTTQPTTTTSTTTTTTTTATTTATTTEPPTEPPTPAPTEAPYVPPTPVVDHGYVLNTSTMKFHYPDCASVEKINPDNRVDTDYSRDDVISWGYSPCGRCKP